MPRVFVSYSHDSDEHQSKVVLLVQSLRALGIDARVDQMFIHEVPELWRWMLDELKAADYVLVICSEGYQRKSAPSADQDHGTGVGWEVGVMMRELYAAPKSARRRYIPVLLDDAPAETVPEVLRSTLWHRVEFSAVPDVDANHIRGLLETLVSDLLEQEYRQMTAEVQPRLLAVPGLEGLFRKLAATSAFRQGCLSRRSRGPCWYAKYRLPDGRQVQKKLGPAWIERGRPPAGYVTHRTRPLEQGPTTDAIVVGAETRA